MYAPSVWARPLKGQRASWKGLILLGVGLTPEVGALV